MKQKIAIFIDYALRTPGFHESYSALKQYLFETQPTDLEIEGEFILRDFWKDELKKDEVSKFYAKATPPENNLENKVWRKYFFNEDHYRKFIDDYSFNLYVDNADVPNLKDVQMINIAQEHLFDIVLVDEFLAKRKRSNTLFFLSKIRVLANHYMFIPEGTELPNQHEYLGIWNPKTNSNQMNGEGYGEFEIWMKEMEQKYWLNEATR